MSALSNRMKKARQSPFEIGGYTFIILRPTVYEMVRYKEEGGTPYKLADECVVDWKGVHECDIIEGGAAEEIPFDRDTWSSWLQEKGEWWAPIGLRVIQVFNEYVERTEAATKN